MSEQEVREFEENIVKGANIVLFLIATTSIVEILNNNGCFDFAAEWMRTRKPRKLLWLLFIFTFVLSANLDNLAQLCSCSPSCTPCYKVTNKGAYMAQSSYWQPIAVVL